jgi:hypothetical protein
MTCLQKEELSEQERMAIFNLLMAIKRDLPMLALMVIGIWVVQKGSIEALGNAFPDINIEVLDRITMLQYDEASRQDPVLLRQTFRDAMLFVEELNDRLVERVGRGSASVKSQRVVSEVGKCVE